MAGHKHDFEALSQAITDSTIKDIDSPDDPEVMHWDIRYPLAIDKALVRFDFTLLVGLLKQQRPIHPSLLPALADALDARGKPKPPARRKVLTTIEEGWVTSNINSARRTGASREDAIAFVAEMWGLSESTIKRAYLSEKARAHYRRR